MSTAPSTILLVEDNFLVGEAIRLMLESLGWSVVGPIASAAEARRLVHEAPFAAAVLDINLRDGSSIAIARDLEALERPYVFLTGYLSPQVLPEPMRRVPRLSKPVERLALQEALSRAIGWTVDNAPANANGE